MTVANANYELVEEYYNKMERTLMAVDLNVAQFLFNFIVEHDIKRTLEIGLGEGASAMAVMLGTGEKHIAIDSLAFTTQGVTNMELLGMSDQIRIIEGVSEFILPELIKEGNTFQYSFIDGANKIDDFIVDFNYISKMTELNGFIFIPDNLRPSVKKFEKFIEANRHDYEILPTPKGTRLTIIKKIAEEDSRDWGFFNDF